MLSSFVKMARLLCYKYPKINEDILGSGKFANLKIALITDYLTTVSLSYECRIKCLTTQNYQNILTEWKPDFIFVESAFHGYNWSWSYKLAKKSKIFEFDYLKDFNKLITLAKDLKIPTVFWNKDDGAFFEVFIGAASLCDYIYTADICSVEKYKNYLTNVNSGTNGNNSIINNSNFTISKLSNESELPYSNFIKDGIKYSVNEHKIGLMKMAIQPRIHSFKGFNFCKHAICFSGSYYKKILDNRRAFLNEMFLACSETNMKMDIYDRNSNRISRGLEFKYPKYKNVEIHPKLTNEQTAEIYRQYNVSLNVNSITASETMCSRRLLEILACGGILATNSSKAVELMFKDYCTIIHNKDEAKEILPKMVLEPSKKNLEKAQAGSLYIANNFTWENRLEQLADEVSF